ncbi:MAG: hypothetical protein COA52_17385 [Hyphomicrobiales bacterium]|nr:MAG: hypothetical protein COA52_17385 [Hyphomicrobiales bacterium]
MVIMKHFLAILVITGLTSISAAAQTGYEGLFYPKGDDGAWNCQASSLGEYGGSLGVEDNILYGTEWACELKAPRQTDSGTEFIGDCHAEGTPYRDIITLERTQNGLRVKYDAGTSEWL